MEVWFYSRIGTRPRGQHDALKNLKSLHPRSSRGRRESFCPLPSLTKTYNGSRVTGHLVCPIKMGQSELYLVAADDLETGAVDLRLVVARVRSLP